MRVLAVLLCLFAFGGESFGSFVLVAKLDRVGTLGGANGGGEFRMRLGRIDETNISATNGSGVTWLDNTNVSSDLLSKNFEKVGSDYFYKFKTFCVETNEFLNGFPDAVYKVGGNFFTSGQFVGLDSLSTGAFKGGVSGATNNVDYISNSTANLYADWSNGSSTNGFNSKDNTKANGVQSTIWYNEGESNGSNVYSGYNNADPADPNSKVMNLFSWAPSSGTYASYHTKLLNFSTESLASVRDTVLLNSAFQSQIVYSVPASTTAVPEPATAGLLGLGMLVAGAYRARRKNKANA